MKTTAWNEIKAEYLQGVTPKELSLKYKIPAKTIHEKASKESWVDEKASINASICKNVQEVTQERIQNLTNDALDTLCEVVNDKKCEKNVRVQAAKAILDISGLKNSKQVIEGIEGGVNVVINREAVSVESLN
jgi:uncharacterized protein (UPF0147 family)